MYWILEVELTAMARFLLASLIMDAILAEVTVHLRRQALDRMIKGVGLEGAYDTTLDRISEQGGSKAKLGMKALMWISRCKRPLRSRELRQALAVELGAEEFSTENLVPIGTLLGYTLGLATIDGRTSNPRLLHFTLQEYLDQHPRFVTAHSMMAEICLTYLNCPRVRALRPNLDSARGAPLLLEYATCFWGSHASGRVTGTAKSLALRLLDGYENHVSATFLWTKKPDKWDWGWAEDSQGISGLHCIAF